MSQEPKNNEKELAKIIQQLVGIIVILLVALIVMPIVFYHSAAITAWFKSKPKKEQSLVSTGTLAQTSSDSFWKAPDIEDLQDGSLKTQVMYGQALIAHTSKYLGPNGSVSQTTNGMNCQNCHLDAGTRIWGNNYGSVASTYPKFRARSGTTEDIYKRVNDCFERSLNGKALDTSSKEMQAIKAYIEYLGKDVKKGERAEGSGFKDVGFLDRAADPLHGKAVYEQKCMSCHKPNGEGELTADRSEYIYPPLWGDHSYNDGAGLYRLVNFAKYIKYNMPLGATHANPQLSDEEAWDLAAFVNSQPRPHKNVAGDWPDMDKKPIDHPFGPYSDGFTQQQHKFGPFKPIEEARNKKK